MTFQVILTGSVLSDVASALFFARDASLNVSFSALSALADNLATKLFNQNAALSSDGQRSWFLDSDFIITDPLSNGTAHFISLNYFDAAMLYARNAFTAALPRFTEDAVRARQFIFSNGLTTIWDGVSVSGSISSGDISYFSSLSTIVLLSLALVCAFLVLFIIAISVKTLRDVITRFRAATISIAVSLLIGRRAAKKISRGYKDAEDKLGFRLKDSEQNLADADVRDLVRAGKSRKSLVEMDAGGGVLGVAQEMPANRVDDGGLTIKEGGGIESTKDENPFAPSAPRAASDDELSDEEVDAISLTSSLNVQRVKGQPVDADAKARVMSQFLDGAGAETKTDAPSDASSTNASLKTTKGGSGVRGPAALKAKVDDGSIATLPNEAINLPDSKIDREVATASPVSSPPTRSRKIIAFAAVNERDVHSIPKALSSAQSEAHEVGDSHFNRVLFIVLAVCLAGVVAVSVSNFQIIGGIQILAPKSMEARSLKSVIVDLVPPSISLIRPLLDFYLYLEAKTFNNTAELLTIRDDISNLRSSFNQRVQYWDETLMGDDGLKELLTGRITKTANKFFSFGFDTFIPLVNAGNLTAARSVILADMDILHNDFDALIAEASALCDADIKKAVHELKSTPLLNLAIVGAAVGGAVVAFAFAVAFAGERVLEALRRWLSRRVSHVYSGADERPASPTKSLAVSTALSEAALGGMGRPVILFLCVYVVVIAALTAGAAAVGNSTSTLSDSYKSLSKFELLLEEIAPPNLYLEYAFLHNYVISYALDYANIEEGLMELVDGISRFNDAQTSWCTGSIPTLARAYVCDRVRASGVNFQELFEGPFTVKVNSSDVMGFRAFVATAMRRSFEEHRSEVTWASRQIRNDYLALEKSVFYDVGFSRILLAFAAVVAMALPPFIAWILLYDPNLKRNLRVLDFLSRGDGSARSTLFSRLRASIRRSDVLWFRPPLHAAVFILLLSFTALSILLPIRHLPEVNALAPVASKVATRSALSFLSIHLLRELVLAKGIASRADTAVALRNVVRDFAALHADIKAIVKLDDPAQVELLYSPSCLLLSKSNCSVPPVHFPSVVGKGLDYLVSFFISLQVDLASTYRDRENFNSSVGPRRYVDSVMDADSRISFVFESFSADLAQGFARSGDLVIARSAELFSEIHFELRLLYGAYLGLVAIGFFAIYLRSTISTVKQEAEKVRTFIKVLPMHMINSRETELTVKRLFVNAEEDENDTES